MPDRKPRTKKGGASTSPTERATQLRGTVGGAVLTRWFGKDALATLDGYRKLGGYRSFEKALGMAPADVAGEVKASGLRGRGGAGFPTGVKWGFLPPPDGGPRYVVVNADESEPGTAKDRYLMENSPHMLIEGILIACWAVQATQAWVYIRGEYDRPHQMLVEAIAEARKAGLVGPKPFGKDFPTDIQLFRGHGAYICGEETALLESLEGKRAQPRSRPPFPAVKGAWGRPTLLNNVETIATLPWIIEKGGAEYAKFGTEKSHGTRMYTVSGDVQKPGNYEMEIGKPFTHLINELAGGPLPGHQIKAFWPGGSSAPVLPASMLDHTTDFDELARIPTIAGSGGVIVADERRCMVRMAYRLLQFYAHESCGKCTPCRVGGNWAVRTYERVLAGHANPNDLRLFDNIQNGLASGRCLCALGDSAGWVIQWTMARFREEYEEHILRGECSAEQKKVAAGV